MSILLPSFDPTQSASGFIQTNMGTDPGKIVAANHSGVTLVLTFADGQRKKLWANTARLFVIDIPLPQIPWQQDTILVVQGGYNRVDLELYSLEEELSETYPIALTAPPQIAPASFVSIGNATPVAASTWTPCGNITNLGNFPFVNNEIDAGIATAGTIFFPIYTVTVSYDPGFRDGATVEGAVVQVRFSVLDSSSAVVGATSAFFVVALNGKGGGGDSIATLTTPSPIYAGCICSVGAGAPYTAQAQIETNDPYPAAHFLNVVLSMAFGIVAAPPTGLALT